MRANANRNDDDVNLYKHIGQRIKERRKTMNVSQAQIAKMMNLSPQQIQKYESGLSQMFIERIFQFAQILNVSPEYFYEGIEFRRLGTRIDNDVIDINRIRPLNILLIDRSLRDILLFERALQQSFQGGAVLHGVSEPNKAMDHIRDTPDMIVIDICSLKDSGFQLIRSLKANSSTSAIPIVILTNNTSRKTMIEAYRLGVAGFVPKAANENDFRDSIRRFLEYWVKTVVLP